MYYNLGLHMSTTISVRLPDELAKELANIAGVAERSKSYVVQKALEAYMEDYADLQISLDRLNDPTDEAISPEALRRTLGHQD